MLSGVPIPNNVDLESDPRLERALRMWASAHQHWWNERGPRGFADREVYLRTAISVQAGGLTSFSHVRMADYRWGIFLAPPVTDRRIACGDLYGTPVWNEVPGEFRSMLWRLIATQGDTEPASVEQQRLLGQTAPSLYDLRNLFQVNVEEARHLWAMVYLLHRYFGAEGQEESHELLQRRSGCPDKPRVLDVFNQRVETWLDFFLFTMFADRDGKYQLGALAQSAFDPLARTCQFMCVEEAHHLFVGESGIGRVIERTAQLMAEGCEVRRHGAIPLEILQRYINRWFPLCLDLFGSEQSNNAARFFAAGVKTRFHERHYQDHRLTEAERRMLNDTLRDDYIRDCQRAVACWNRLLMRYGQDPCLFLPDRRFHRQQGVYAGHAYDPRGNLPTPGTSEDEGTWLPRAEDYAYVESVMVSAHEPGLIASWIAPPNKGINGMPITYEYVRP